MAFVQRALDTRTGRAVALKVLLRPLAPGSNEQRRFQREVAALRKLRHPGVVEVLEAGEHQGRGFLALEYLEGGTLEERIKRKGRLSSGETAELGRALAKALHAAHMEQIVHRDLKPANVLFDTSGKAKLADFGLARSIEVEASRLTQSGVFLGTPGYMAPEQVRGSWEEIGPGADVYGLGATLFACLSGVAPVEGDTLADVLVNTERGRRRSFSALGVEVEPRLGAVIERCLSVSIEDRYGSAVAVGEALEEVEEVVAGRRGWVVWLGACVVAAGVGAGLGRQVEVEEVEVEEEVREVVVGEVEEGGRARLDRLRAELRRDPLSVEARLALVEACIASGRLLEAIEDVQYLEAIAPTSAAVAEVRGRLEEAKGAVALGSLDRRLQEDPEDLDALERRAAAQVLLGNSEGVRVDLERLVALEPEEARHRFRLGQWFKLAQRLDEALPWFEGALRLDPKFHEVLRERCDLHWRRRDAERFVEDLRRWEEVAPRDVFALSQRATWEQQSGSLEAALATYEEALALAPEFTVARRNRAVILGSRGRALEVLEDLAAAVARHPEDAVARYQLALAYLQGRRVAEAWEELEVLYEVAPRDVNLAILRVRCLVGLGRAVEALEVAESFAGADPPGSSEVLRAVAYASAGAPEQARVALEAAEAALPAGHPLRRRVHALRVQLEGSASSEE